MRAQLHKAGGRQPSVGQATADPRSGESGSSEGASGDGGGDEGVGEGGGEGSDSC